MNSSGALTRCVLPPRQDVFSFSKTHPAASHCTCTLANAEWVTERHSCTGAQQSSALQCTAVRAGLSAMSYKHARSQRIAVNHYPAQTRCLALTGVHTGDMT